jgi:hypothetical protein
MKQKNNMNLIEKFNLKWANVPYILNDDFGSNTNTLFLAFGAKSGCTLSELEYYIEKNEFPEINLGHSYVGETCYKKDNKLRSNTLVCVHDLIRTPSFKPPTNFAIPTKNDLVSILGELNKNVSFSPGVVGSHRGSLGISDGSNEFSFSFNGYFKVNKEDKKITHEGTFVEDYFTFNQGEKPILRGQYIWSDIYLLTNTFNADFTKYYVIKLHPNIDKMFELATYTKTIDDGGGGGGEPVPTGTTEETGAVSTYSSRYIQKWFWTYNKTTKEFIPIQEGHNPGSGFDYVHYYNEESSKLKTVTITTEEWPIDENIYNLYNVLPIYCDELKIGLEEGKVFKNGHIDYILNQTAGEDILSVISNNHNNFLIEPTIKQGIIQKQADICTISTNSMSNLLVFLKINTNEYNEIYNDIEIIDPDTEPKPKQFSIKYKNNNCKLTISVNGYSESGVYDGYDNSLFYYDGTTINIDTNKLFRSYFKVSLGLKIETEEDSSKVYNKIPLPSIYKPYYTENIILIDTLTQYLTIINKIHNGVGLYEEILLSKKNEEEYNEYTNYNKTLVSPTNVNDVKTYSIENYVGFLPEELRKTNGLRIAPNGNGVVLSSYNICELTNKISFRDSQDKEIFNYEEVSMVSRDKALFFCDEYEGTVTKIVDVNIENEIKKDEDTDENVKVYNLKLNNIKYNAKYLSVIDEYLNNKLNEDIELNINVNFADVNLDNIKYNYHEGSFHGIVSGTYEDNSFDKTDLCLHIKNHDKYKERYYFVNESFVYEYIYGYGLISADGLALKDFFYKENKFGFSNIDYYEMFPEQLDFNSRNEDDGEFIISCEDNKIIPFFNMYPSIVKRNLGQGTILKPNYNINAPMAFEINSSGQLVNNFYMNLHDSEAQNEPQFYKDPPSTWYLIGCYSELTALNGNSWDTDYSNTDYYKELYNGSVLNKHENFNTVIKFYGEVQRTNS